MGCEMTSVSGIKITKEVWAKIESHFQCKCELNERGEIVYWGQHFPVGYVATDEYAGWLVDMTGDQDELICNLMEVRDERSSHCQ